jgi:hypothetical protein
MAREVWPCFSNMPAMSPHAPSASSSRSVTRCNARR